MRERNIGKEILESLKQAISSLKISRLEDGEDHRGHDWPFERCKSDFCEGRRNLIGFDVPDKIWSKVVPKDLNVVCLTCFDEMAQEKGISYRNELETFPLVTWEDIEK